ncbi:hypothetical protein MUK42_06088 [Musa troglodytarum]|uniref:Uncharacterized protein n=1 Tax=Musa troglodytarum TaxID=320322 RepID=A0A9E7G8F5_9LILI|nr:hypothetical protein MUK42_06088 [Musa troglodytarum]
MYIGDWALKRAQACGVCEKQCTKPEDMSCERHSSMARGCVVVEVTTTTSTEPLLPNRVSYARNLSHVDDKLRSFWSCLRWMCIDQFNTRHTMIIRTFLVEEQNIVKKVAKIQRAKEKQASKIPRQEKKPLVDEEP